MKALHVGRVPLTLLISYLGKCNISYFSIDFYFRSPAPVLINEDVRYSHSRLWLNVQQVYCWVNYNVFFLLDTHRQTLQHKFELTDTYRYSFYIELYPKATKLELYLKTGCIQVLVGSYKVRIEIFQKTSCLNI